MNRLPIERRGARRPATSALFAGDAFGFIRGVEFAFDGARTA